MSSRRLLSLVAVALLAVVGLTGCVAIKTETSSTRAPGVAMISLSICASHRATGSNCIPSPNATPGLVVNTAEGDNGQDALTSSDPSNPLKGQLVVGFRLPTGTVAPDQFTSVTGEQFNKSQGYSNALTATIPPATGFRWVGYVSSAVTVTGGASLTSLNVEFGLPAAADGSPFTGPFLWRAIVGQIGIGVDPASCSAGSSCFDSPQPANLATHFQQNVSDFRVMLGTGAPSVAPGESATVSFQVRYIDNAAPKFGARTLNLTGSSTLPGNPQVTPSSATLTNVVDGTTRTVTAGVTVPAGTAPGNYPVTLTTTDKASGVARSNTSTVTVVDRTAPTISIGSPTEGVVLAQQQQIAASYSCADEPNGSGVASCAGPVAPGAPIDTATVGPHTFTVSASDAAGNRSAVSTTYTVAPRPTVQGAGVTAVSFGLAFNFSASTSKATKFTSIQVKNVPAGATVSVTCKGKGCPATKLKGKRKPLTFTKKKASGTVSLKPWAKASLPVGTVLTVTVTKPGTTGMVKKLTVRARKAPSITTSCLKPGAKKPTAC